MNTKEEFPKNIQQQENMRKIVENVDNILASKALQIPNRATYENIIKCSLVGALCFQAHLYNMLHQCSTMNSYFGGIKDARNQKLVLELSMEELTSQHFETKDDYPTAHYFSLLHAAREEGIDCLPFEIFRKFCKQQRSPHEIQTICKQLGFAEEITDYLIWSITHCKPDQSIDISVARIGTSELILGEVFEILKQHLKNSTDNPNILKWYGGHIDLDTKEHGDHGQSHSQMMYERMSRIKNPELAAQIIEQFTKLRLNLYNACMNKKMW